MTNSRNSKGPPKSVIEKAALLFKEEERKRRSFFERYGHARVPVCAQMDGKWFVAVGSHIYRQVQEGPYGFVNVLHDHALTFFGVPFLETQEAKPFLDRHPAIQWMGNPPIFSCSQKWRN